MTLTLPSSVSSSQDLAELLLEVQNYARWYAHESIKKRVAGGRMAESPLKSPALAELLREWTDKTPLSRQSLDDLIATLKTYQSTASTLTITLAAPAPGSLKADLVAWCRENIAPNVLVTFHFNSTLLGGMTIRHGSRVFDWSFKRQLLEGRAAFTEVLRRV